MFFVFILHGKDFQLKQFVEKGLGVGVLAAFEVLEEFQASAVELVEEEELVIGEFGHDNILQSSQILKRAII